MAADSDEAEDRDPLTRLAGKLADGEEVDWAAEAASTPDLAAEICELEQISMFAQTPWREAMGRASPEQDAGPLAPGDTWGPLTVIERIGFGAAGDVYRAFDPNLGRDVALKIWRESAFYRSTGTEARKLRKVRHPAVLRVHGVARHGGLAGMWTDFLEGRNLEETLVQRGPLSVEAASRIGISICDAIDAIHASDMVHRDIKASNVVCLADDSVVLVDLGSAKELPGGVPVASERIRGAPLGTAPEVLRGEAIGPAADVYSLGVLLYRLVSGAYPIEARNLLELSEKVEARELVPLHERRPECDRGFAEVVSRALAFDPAERPTLAAIRAALTPIAR